MFEPYLYPTQDEKIAPKKAGMAKFAKDEEVLSGVVKDMSAAAGEERLARALDKHPAVLGYEFRKAVGAPRGMPGWKELDFLIETAFRYVAVEVDNMSFIHLGRDAESVFEDAQRIEGLAKISVDVYEIKHVDEARLSVQIGAEQVARELL
jgi:hypothetical protein